MKPPTSPIFLAGPTGSGKTAVALALAGIAAPIEIVNADAFQAYRGMEILTAAPGAEDQTVCPHHLFGFLDPSLKNDAASFAARARELVASIAGRALPLVVGGSGLYLKAITHGLAPVPPADPALRAELEALPPEERVARYRALDPEGAAQTNLQNPRYVLRNLEICLLSGRPASELKREWAEQAPRIRGAYLHRERAELEERIASRTAAMFDAGVVAEVARLGEVSPTAAKAIGFPEIRSLLAGEIDETACREAIWLATRRYAKRQETWFKREAEFVRFVVPCGEAPGETAARIGAHFGLVR